MSKILAKQLKAGEVYEFNTHAELLNKVFGTNYKAWMKCWWRYSYDTVVWFGRIDGKIRNNFKNTWLNESAYTQCYVGNTGIYDGKQLNINDEYAYRLVFDIIDGSQRKYIFKGFFRLVKEKSTSERLFFEKVSNVFPMN